MYFIKKWIKNFTVYCEQCWIRYAFSCNVFCHTAIVRHILKILIYLTLRNKRNPFISKKNAKKNQTRFLIPLPFECISINLSQEHYTINSNIWAQQSRYKAIQQSHVPSIERKHNYIHSKRRKRQSHLQSSLRDQQVSLAGHNNSGTGFRHQRRTIFQPGQVGSRSASRPQAPEGHLAIQLHRCGLWRRHKLLPQVWKNSYLLLISNCRNCPGYVGQLAPFRSGQLVTLVWWECA